MYACDFEYDGKYLSDRGYMICAIDDIGGADADAKGSEITFNRAPVNSGKWFRLNGTKYDSCLTATFHICRDPEVYDPDLMEISREDFRDLAKWLNRREFCQFRAIDAYEPEIPQPYFYASFNLTKILVGSKCYGVKLEMETNSPFGYTGERWFTLNMQANTPKNFRDISEEPGNILPQMKITCKGSGTLTLTNTMTGCRTEIKNCVNGEVITFSGDTQIIESSVAGHDITNDFNYDFFTVGNTPYDSTNTITASMDCKVELGYNPIQKDTI